MGLGIVMSKLSVTTKNNLEKCYSNPDSNDLISVLWCSFTCGIVKLFLLLRGRRSRGVCVLHLGGLVDRPSGEFGLIVPSSSLVLMEWCTQMVMRMILRAFIFFHNPPLTHPSLIPSFFDALEDYQSQGLDSSRTLSSAFLPPSQQREKLDADQYMWVHRPWTT